MRWRTEGPGRSEDPDPGPPRAAAASYSLESKRSGCGSEPTCVSGGGVIPRCAYAAGVAARPAGAHQQALLDEIRLVDILDRLGRFTH